MATNTNTQKLHTSTTGLRWWTELGWRYIVGILVIIYAVVPLLYIVSVSLNPGGTLTGSNQLFAQVSLEN